MKGLAMGNAYQDALEQVISKFVDVFQDRKVSFKEAWSILVVISSASKQIMQEAQEFTEEDCDQLVEAAQELFDIYVRPIDLPGPDRLIDPILKRYVIPGLIHGVHQALARGAEL